MIQGASGVVLWTIVALYAVLGLATLVRVALQRVRPGHDHTELKRRIRSWWVIITLFSVAVMLQQGPAIVFFGFVSFLALKEYLSLIPTRRADRRVLFWVYLTIPVQYLWVYQHWYGMFIVFIPVWIFLFLPTRMLLIGATEGFLKAVGTLHWGVMLTVFNLSHAAYLLSLPIVSAPAAGMLLYLVILTEFNDVAQYVWGKTFGRSKIVPSVSPGKTWAGFIGGALSTGLLSVVIAPWLTCLDGWHRVTAGLAIAVAGFLGDITISAVKRDIGVKDSGTFIPGHGGVLDRVDSLTFSAPVFFHYVFYFYGGLRLTTM